VMNLVGQATQQRFDLGIMCDQHGPSVVDSLPLLASGDGRSPGGRLLAGPPPPTQARP
jgi:hypothetical protein